MTALNTTKVDRIVYFKMADFMLCKFYLRFLKKDVIGPFENKPHSKQCSHRVKVARQSAVPTFPLQVPGGLSQAPSFLRCWVLAGWHASPPENASQRVRVPWSRCPESLLLTTQTQGQAGACRPNLGGPRQPIHLASWATTLGACHGSRRPPCVCPPGGSGGSPMWCPCPPAPPAPHVLRGPGAKILGSRLPRAWPRPRSSLPNSGEAELQTPAWETESQSLSCKTPQGRAAAADIA